MIGLLERTEFEGRICSGGGIERSGARLEASDKRRARCSPSSGCVARRPYTAWSTSTTGRSPMSSMRPLGGASGNGGRLGSLADGTSSPSGSG
jgi:hypothetical protein